MTRQNEDDKRRGGSERPSDGRAGGQESGPAAEDQAVASPAPQAGEASPAGKIVRPRIREKTTPCPVCGRPSLIGYWVDLPAEKIEYNNLFLPIPAPDLIIDGHGLSNTLTLLDNFFCPNDLYTFTGHIKVREKDRGRDYLFDNNVFYRLARFYNVLHDDLVGNRLVFLFKSLGGWGFDMRRLAPVDDGEHDVEPIWETWNEMLEACDKEHPHIRDIYALFRHLVDYLHWNPLELLTPNFHRSASFMAAFFEMQLADLLFLFRREKIKRSQPVQYQELYRLLESYRKMCLADEPMDDDLAGNMLFHCLKMANLIAGNRQRLLLETAHAISKFLVRIKSRVGADLNRKMDVLAANADVTFYLFLRLTRELKMEDELADPVARLLRRRLELIADYAMPQGTPESTRVARIGRFLKKFLDELEKEW